MIARLYLVDAMQISQIVEMGEQAVQKDQDFHWLDVLRWQLKSVLVATCPF